MQRRVQGGGRGAARADGGSLRARARLGDDEHRRDPALDGPEIREALWRRASDDDVFTRAEAVHGLARRGDPRAAALLIAELSRDHEHTHLFDEAASCYLGFGEDDKPDRALLLAMLQNGLTASRE